MDPDAEVWKDLQNLAPGSLTVARYVHQMRYCFNGITLLPVKTGECIRCFQAGLNPAVHCLTVTAPLELAHIANAWIVTYPWSML